MRLKILKQLSRTAPDKAIPDEYRELFGALQVRISSQPSCLIWRPDFQLWIVTSAAPCRSARSMRRELSSTSHRFIQLLGICSPMYPKYCFCRTNPNSKITSNQNLRVLSESLPVSGITARLRSSRDGTRDRARKLPSDL
jgi:hypothetical protein